MFSRGLLALMAVFAVACGGSAPTPSPRPVASQDPAYAWAMTGPVTTTCLAWNHMTSSDQTALTTSMLGTLRSLDPPANHAPATSAQVEALRTALVNGCTAGIDCTDPDKFCDSDRISFAAYAEYAVNLDEMRK